MVITRNQLTGDNSDNIGVELVLIPQRSLPSVGEALPAGEGGVCQHVQREEVSEEVVHVAVGVGATQLLVVRHGNGDAVAYLVLREYLYYLITVDVESLFLGLLTSIMR